MKVFFILVTILGLLFGLGFYILKQAQKFESQAQRTVSSSDLAHIQQFPDIPEDLRTIEVIQNGKTLFLNSCERCHGVNGQGGGAQNEKGPNLTDDYWIHGKGDYASILAIITQGVPGTAMPGWKNSLREEDLMALAAYTRALSGTFPPNAADPQGKKITP
jgi:cbb3-type cytochrome c oxidase subunit III